MSARLCGRWRFCLVGVLGFSLWLKRRMDVFLRCVLEEGSGCDVSQRSRSTNQQQLVLGRIGRGGGFLLLLRSTSCQDVDTVPPHHQAQNLIPGQMCCSGGQASLCLRSSTISARKLNSSLVSLALLWCSAKLKPPQLCWKCFISPKLSCAGVSLRWSSTSVSGVVSGCHRRWGQERPASTPDQPAQGAAKAACFSARSGALINLGCGSSSITVHVSHQSPLSSGIPCPCLPVHWCQDAGRVGGSCTH